MKNIVIFVAIFSNALLLSGQATNPATAREIQDKIKQAQQQLDKLTPEQKMMMEQMGMSTTVPSMPAIIKDDDVRAAMSADAFSVPSRNAVLIAAIPNIKLTAATLDAYVKAVNGYIENGIGANEKFMAEKTFGYYKSNKYSPEMIGNEAIGYWTRGWPELAVYLMGKACAEDGTDPDLLSNFAAVLSMSGAPHKAIPILEYLNDQYPGNTTVLNNLGQAWFYLGEVNKADELLNQVLKAFAFHPQANYTQCLIAKSKGNTSRAIEKMKNSLAYSFSLDKISMLRKLGYTVKGADMRLPFRPDANPLGLRNFTRPEVPGSYSDELRVRRDWDSFQQQIGKKLAALNSQLQPYISAANNKAAQDYKRMSDKKGSVTLSTVLNQSSAKAQPGNIYEQVALKNLEGMNKDGGTAYRLKKAKAKIDSIRKDFIAKDLIQRKSIEDKSSITAANETELAKKGENIGFDNCVVQGKYSEWVYKNYNRGLEEACQDYIHQLYLKISETLYWKQFTMDERSFEAEKLVAKKEWLTALYDTRYIATDKYGVCNPPEVTQSKYRLADFDEMHCAYKSSLALGPWRQVFECGKSSVEFDAGKLSGQFDFKFDNNGENHFVKGTLEATIINKNITMSKGPLQVGASVKAGVGVEFTSRGVEDVYATGEAKVTVGSDTVSDPSGLVSDPNITITASGRMSLISGNMTGAISGFGK